MRLIADIGGTNARFMLARPGEAAFGRWDAKVAEYTDFPAALRVYLAQAGSPGIDEVCIDVAGPVSNGEARLTNAPWSLSERELCALTGARRARLFNDLEAVATAIPFFGDTSTPIDRDRRRPGSAGAPCIIIAPGTGLGAGIHVPARNKGGAGISFGTEACHARMVLASGPLLERLCRVVPLDDHTPETFLSGPGLTRIDKAFGAGTRGGEVIARAALAGDAPSRAVIGAFLDILARFAGAEALITASFGGVYLSGGIVQGLAPLIDAERFRVLFNDHPPMSRMLDNVPVFIVKEEDPALLGLANYRFT